MASTLQEMTQLHVSRPGAHASAAVVAAWYQRKAVLLEHLAAEGNPHAARLAAEAHEHAADLLAATHEAVAA